MSTHNWNYNSGDTPSFNGLPNEPNSTSELLAATHIFTVEILSLKATPWVAAADGLQYRRLDMEARLTEIYKGSLNVARQNTFRLSVEQRRESEFTVSDYHGLWTHVEPQPAAGVGYLVVAQGRGEDPAVLMQEEFCRRLLDRRFASDVQLALGAERLYQNTVGIGRAPRLDGAEALLNFAQQQRTRSRDLFARYLWARVEPVFTTSEGQLLPGLLSLISAPDAGTEFRRSLIADFTESFLSTDPPPALRQKAVRAFFSLLLQREASELHQHLLEIELYNLVFEDDQPKVSAHSAFPNPQERRQLKGVLAAFKSERAELLSKWLNGP